MVMKECHALPPPDNRPQALSLQNTDGSRASAGYTVPALEPLQRAMK